MIEVLYEDDDLVTVFLLIIYLFWGVSLWSFIMYIYCLLIALTFFVWSVLLNWQLEIIFIAIHLYSMFVTRYNWQFTSAWLYWKYRTLFLRETKNLISFFLAYLINKTLFLWSVITLRMFYTHIWYNKPTPFCNISNYYK